MHDPYLAALIEAFAHAPLEARERVQMLIAEHHARANSGLDDSGGGGHGDPDPHP